MNKDFYYSLDYVRDVLWAFEVTETTEDLWWKTAEDNGVRFFANCSDIFWWATSDVEDITPEDIPLLHKTVRDLQNLEKLNKESYATCFLPELYAARKRKMRPQKPYLYSGKYVKDEEVQKLFETCGPERDE